QVSVTGQSGAASGDHNYGVLVFGAGSAITSAGGAVTVLGTGGGRDGSRFNHGVVVEHGGTIEVGGDSDLAVTGTGGSGGDNYGVFVADTGRITSHGLGRITVRGTGTGTSGSNDGIRVEDRGLIEPAGDGYILGYLTLTLAGTGT